MPRGLVGKMVVESGYHGLVGKVVVEPGYQGLVDKVVVEGIEVLFEDTVVLV